MTVTMRDAILGNFLPTQGPIGRYDNGDSRVYIDPVNSEVVLTSVTTVLNATEEKVQLRRWIAKLTAEFAVDQMDFLFSLRMEQIEAAQRKALTTKSKLLEDDLKAIQAKVRDDLVAFIKAEAERLRNLASEMGTYQHDVLEALLLDNPIPSIPIHLIDAEVDGEMIDLDEISDGLLNFHVDFDIDAELAEATVANPALGYAGTLDLVARIPGMQLPHKKTKGARGLFDLKCGKNLYPSMRAQVEAYRRCTEVWVDRLGNKIAMPEVDFCAIVHLRKTYERGYKLIVLETGDVDFDRFLHALQTYKDQQETGSKLGGTVYYPPLEDGSQPLPLVEDVDRLGRARTPLKTAGLRSISDLAALTRTEVLALKGIGEKTIVTCAETLGAYSLSFAPETEEVA